MPKRKKNAKDTKSKPGVQSVKSQDDDARAQPATDAPAPDPQPEPEQDQATAQAERDRDFWAALAKARRLANEGDLKAQHAVRECLHQSPHIRSHFGDIAKYAETAFVEAMSDGDFLVAEAVRQDAAELRQALLGPDPSPMEELAVRRLVACWQQLQYAEMLFTQAEKKDIATAKYWLKRRDQAHKLYTDAEKSLLLMRKLLPSSNPSAPTIEQRPLLPAAAPPVLGDHRTAAGGEVDVTHEELIPPGGYQRPTNGHRHRLAGLLAPVDAE